MSGKREDKSKATKKDRRVSFANAIIVLCVGVSLLVTLAVLYEYHRLSQAIPSGVVSALLGLWGGELLIVALRQIFGSDVVGRNKSGGDDMGSI